jgi:uncharacterized protein
VQPRCETFRDTGGQWRWRLRAANGAKVATSGESFDSRRNASRPAAAVKRIEAEASLPVASKAMNAAIRAVARRR